MVIDFKSYKHSKNTIRLLSIPASNNREICPVKLLKKYLHNRPPSIRTTLFLTSAGKTVTRKFISEALTSILKHSPYSHLNINTHSLRIGRTTDLVMSGRVSDAKIQQLGRWSSEAYKKYIRPHIVGV